MGRNSDTRISKYMYYVAPGAGSVSLACIHGVRYPDICDLCKQDLEGRNKFNLYCAAYAEHDFTVKEKNDSNR